MATTSATNARHRAGAGAATAAVPDLAFIKALCDCVSSKAARCKLLSKAKKKDFELFFEVIKNILVGNIPIGRAGIKRLTKYKKVLVYLAKRSKCVKKKLNILKKNR